MSEARYLHLRGALGRVRTEQYDGREHLVVPVVALMDGVIHAVNASTPERVTAAMLARAAHSWNGRPLVLGHPTKDGRQCTANDPAIEASHRFGTIFNSRMSGQKLLMDAYVDLVRAEKLGGVEFVRRLRDGEQCEVSVGAFVTTDSVAGSHNGKAYKATWLETAGDHLAFLPNGVGACSIDMGCGAHRAAMHLVTAEGIETLGGPGSGWTAENGHVPGSQGGSPMQVVAGRYGYISNDGSNFKHPEGHTLTINDAGWIHIKSSAFPRNRIEKSGLKVEGLEKYLQKFHMRNLEDGDGMKSLDRLASFFRSLMPRGWGDDEVKQELRDALLAVEPAIRNGEIVRVKNDAVIYCLYPPSPPYDGYPSTPAPMTYWSRGYTFDTESQKFDVSADRTQVEPTTVYAPMRAAEVLRAAKVSYEDCPSCGGSGNKDGNPCEACDGEGELKAAEEILKAACSCEEDGMKTKAERVAALLKHEHNPLKDEKGLTAADDAALTALEAHCANATTLKAAADKVAADKKTLDDKAAADLKAAQDKAKSVEDQLAEIKVASAKQLSEEEYLAKAPESIRTLVADKKAQDAAAKATVVATLKVAAKGVYSDEELDKMALPELMKLAQLAKVEAPDYSGRGIAAPRHAGEDYASPDPYEAGLKALRQTVN